MVFLLGKEERDFPDILVDHRFQSSLQSRGDFLVNGDFVDCQKHLWGDDDETNRQTVAKGDSFFLERTRADRSSIIWALLASLGDLLVDRGLAIVLAST